MRPPDPPASGASAPVRSEERRAEDQAFTPVIIKRSDEFRRHPDDILGAAIAEGQEQLMRPRFSLLLSAVAAGLILGFTVMAVAVVTATFHTIELPGLVRLSQAIVYPFGFIICVMSGTELFTEHTATAVYPVLDGRSRLADLLALWGLVLAGNLVGAAFSAGLLAVVEPVIQARAGYVEIARHLIQVPNLALAGSAVLAGWLMALGAWLILATPPASAQLLCIYMVTFLIGLGDLHHSIAGALEMFAALLIGDEFTMAQAGRVIGVAVLGNLAGGSLFVAVLNYGHIRQTQ